MSTLRPYYLSIKMEDGNEFFTTPNADMMMSYLSLCLKYTFIYSPNIKETLDRNALNKQIT